MNTFGKLFRVSLYGESHQPCFGVMIDGIPAGIEINVDEMKEFIARRKPQSSNETARREDDCPIIKAGLFNGKTDGSPMVIEFFNQNTNSSDYDQFNSHPRPSHVDLVAKEKWNGFNDYRGSGMFSGRLTAAICAAGFVASKIADFNCHSEIIACGDLADLADLDSYLEDVKKEGDSVGGIIRVYASNPAKGLGEPYFYSLESAVSQIMFSIGSVKGVSFGDELEFAKMKGSQYNDMIISSQGETSTNHAGGVNGGISNGNEIICNVHLRPISSIAKPQETFNFENGKVQELIIKGRHDASIIKRVKVVLESALMIALVDLFLIGKAYK